MRCEFCLALIEPHRMGGYVHTEPFARNPIGVLFDADKMVADYEAGVAEAELLRRP